MNSTRLSRNRPWLGRLLAGVLAAVACAPAAGAQQKPSPPSKAATPAGAAANPSDLDSGFFYGKNWLLFFTAPHGWPDDVAAANALEVIGVVHPVQWDPRKFAPVIYVAIDHRSAQVNTLAAEVEADVREFVQGQPETHVTTAPPLTGQSGRPALVRIFETGHNWQEVAYIDQAPVFLLATLRCVDQAHCRALQPAFARFVKSLRYVANVQIDNHTKR